MDSFNGDNTVIRAGQDELSPINFSIRTLGLPAFLQLPAINPEVYKTGKSRLLS